MSFLLEKKISRAHLTVGKGTYFRPLIGNSDMAFLSFRLWFSSGGRNIEERNQVSLRIVMGSPSLRCLKSPIIWLDLLSKENGTEKLYKNLFV